MLGVKVGKLADRLGARWLLIAGAAAGGLGMLMPYLFPGIPAIFAAGILNGPSAVLFNLLLQNLVGLLSEPEYRARNFGNYSLINALYSFIGPLFAGFTIDHLGHAYACLSLAVFSLAPAAMLAIWGKHLPGGTRHAESEDRRDTGMLSYPGVRTTLVTGSLQNTADSLYQFYMPVYAHAKGLSASAIGVILAMYPAAATVMRIMLTRLILRFQEERLLACAFYLGAGSLSLVPFFSTTITLASISFVLGLGMGCCGPIVTMLMFGSAPPGRSGEALGLKMTINHLTKLVTPMVFGSVASAFGLSPVFWINALMLSVGGYLSYPKSKT